MARRFPKVRGCISMSSSGDGECGPEEEDGDTADDDDDEDAAFEGSPDDGLAGSSGA